MSISIAVLTFNAASTGRRDALLATLRSLNVGLPLYLVDNGSTDETRQMVASFGGARNDGNRTIGGGMNYAIAAAVGSGADLIVFSNDDMAWHPGWQGQVEAFWAAAPPDIGICSGLLERTLWPWNPPVRKAETWGGVTVLERETVPAAAWTFRAAAWRVMRPVPDEDNGWADVPVCHRLRRQGMRLVGADWADHLGDGLSLWGNESYKHGEPLDTAAWGIV